MNKEKDLRKMLETLYEAEALIEMYLRRNATSSADDTMLRLIADKCRGLASIADEWQLPDAPHPSVSAADHALYDASTVVPETSSAPAADADDVALAESEMRELVEMASVDPKDDADSYTPEALNNPDSIQSLELITPELEPGIKETPDEVRFDPPAGYPAGADEAAESKSAAPMSFVEEKEIAESIRATEEEDDSDEAQAFVVPKRSGAPLLSFFTINDRFRFRRSLFEGSNPKLLESIAVIETLDTLEQAVDYMADDLQWDMESPEVKLFCKIVERYFKKTSAGLNR